MIESTSPADKIRALRPEPSRFSCYMQFPADWNEDQVAQTLSWLDQRMEKLDMMRFQHVHLTVSHEDKESDCDC